MAFGKQSTHMNDINWMWIHLPVVTIQLHTDIQCSLFTATKHTHAHEHWNAHITRNIGFISINYFSKTHNDEIMAFEWNFLSTKCIQLDGDNELGVACPFAIALLTLRWLSCRRMVMRVPYSMVHVYRQSNFIPTSRFTQNPTHTQTHTQTPNGTALANRTPCHWMFD